MMATGWVRGYDPLSGKGYISLASGGPLLMFTRSDFLHEDAFNPEHFDPVLFEIVRGLDGEVRAVDVRLCSLEAQRIIAARST